MENLGGGAAKAGALVATDVLIVLGFIAAVAGILAFAVYFVMRFRRNRATERERQIKGLHLPSRRSAPRDEDRDHDGDDDGGGGDSEGDGARSGRRRVRRRRRDHRPRNPSLAEAGGLPPVRPEDSVPPV